jgi:hypothetical protein
MKGKLDFDHPNHRKLWVQVAYQVHKVSVKSIRKVQWRTLWVIVAVKILVIIRGNSSISFWKAYLLVCHLALRKKVNISMKQSHFHTIPWNSLKCNNTINNSRITSMKMHITAKLINTYKVMAGAHAQKYSLYTLYKRGDLAYRLLW